MTMGYESSIVVLIVMDCIKKRADILQTMAKFQITIIGDAERETVKIENGESIAIMKTECRPNPCDTLVLRCQLEICKHMK